MNLVEDEQESVERYNPEGRARCILTCDHASNHLPAAYRGLGLGPAQLQRHVAWDAGAALLCRRVALLIDAPAILGTVSRLLIDVNRGLDDPTLILCLCEFGIIRGNCGLTAQERDLRIRRYYKPYDGAIRKAIAPTLTGDEGPLVISLHSFTPSFRNHMRPWHVGILSNGHDRRLAEPLLRRLSTRADLIVGDNQPYSGALPGDALDRHAAALGLSHVLIEIRQDLIDTAEKCEN
jgi:predicted N-formylglutamate amidohydrolase